MPTTNEQLKTLSDKKGSDADLFVLDKINDVKDDVKKVEENVTDIKQDVRDIKRDLDRDIPEDKRVEKIAQRLQTKFLAADKGDKCDKGDSPSKEEITTLIKPLIPKPIKGDKGDSVKGEKGDAGNDADEEAIANRVKIEIKQPIVDEIEKDIPQLSEPIRDALELLDGEERLDFSAIKGLRNALNKMNNSMKSLGRAKVGGGFSKIAMEGKMVDDETPSGTINGTNKDFTLDHIPNPTGSLKVYRGGARQRITEDYTLSTNTISFTVAPVSGEVLLVDYRI